MIFSISKRCGDVYADRTVAACVTAYDVIIDKYCGYKITGTYIENNFLALPIWIAKGAVIPNPLHIWINGAATGARVWCEGNNYSARPLIAVLPTLTHPHVIWVCRKIPLTI
jgi:hypothetical protein